MAARSGQNRDAQREREREMDDRVLHLRKEYREEFMVGVLLEFLIRNAECYMTKNEFTVKKSIAQLLAGTFWLL